MDRSFYINLLLYINIGYFYEMIRENYLIFKLFVNYFQILPVNGIDESKQPVSADLD